MTEALLKPNPVKHPWLMRLILLALLGCAAAIQLHVYDWTVNMDLNGYAIGAHEVLNGRLLYTDIWDLKPPGIWVTFMAFETLCGYGHHLFFITAMTCAALMILGIYRAGVVSGMGPWAGCFGALIWVMQLGDLDLEMHNTNAEAFINVCMIWSFVGMLNLIGPNPKRWISLAVGLCWLGASLYKHSIIFGLIPLALMYLLICWRMGRGRHGLKDVLLWAGIGIAGWGLVYGYFALQGRMGDLHFTLYTYSRGYGGDTLDNLLRKSHFGFWLEFMATYQQMILLFALNLLALIFLTEKSRWPLALLLIGMLLFAYFNAFCLRRIYGHYFQYWIPVLAVGGGWAIVSIWESCTRLPRWCIVCGTAWFLMGIFISQWPDLTTTQQQYEQSSYDRKLDAQGRQVGRMLAGELAPEDRILLWGYRTEVVFASGCRVTSGVLLPINITKGQFARRLTKMVLDDIRQYPPTRVVICEQWLQRIPIRKKHLITHWIEHHCDRLPESDAFPDYSIWQPRLPIEGLPVVE